MGKNLASDWELLDVDANGAYGNLKLSDVQSTHAQGMEEVGAQGSSAELFSNSKAAEHLWCPVKHSVRRD